MPDPRRREPINVGVLLLGSDGRIHSRFLAEQTSGIDGRILGRKVRSSDNYRAWVAYWRHLVDNGVGFEQLVADARATKPSSYFLEVGGEALATDRSDGEMLDYLFATLVGTSARSRRAAKAEQSFQEVGVSVERDVTISVPLTASGTAERMLDEVYFDYRYQNGHTTLMRNVRLASTRASWDLVHSVRYGFDAVAKHIGDSRLVALVDRANDFPSAQIRILRGCGRVIDLTEPDTATRQMRDLLLHS